MLDHLKEAYEKCGSDDAKIVAEAENLNNDFEKKKAEIFFKIDHPSDNVTAFLEWDTKDDVALYNSPDSIAEYCGRAKFLYDSGDYENSYKLLSKILRIQSNLSNLWGCLASAILTSRWNEANVLLRQLKDGIENKSLTNENQLILRAWLLHWSLFVFTNISNGWEFVIELFMDRLYLQTIENLCPWLLRYLAAAIILCESRRKSHLREILHELSFMSYMYMDPVTKVLESLFKNFDFDEAQERLSASLSLIQKDFFLAQFEERFRKESRILMCELYCVLHQKIDVSSLAVKLQLSEDDIMNITSKISLGASVDVRTSGASKQVVFSPPTKSSVQFLNDKVSDLCRRVEGSNRSHDFHNGRL